MYYHPPNLQTIQKMTDTLNYTELQIITAKDISHICGISIRTAQNYISDIKREYGIHKITYAHLRKYLQI